MVTRIVVTDRTAQTMGATKVKIFKYLAFSALLVMSLSKANAQDYDKGNNAFLVGDYQTAFQELLPLAESGDANAQNSIGVMYAYGKGVEKNIAEAVKWYQLAADQGDASGQLSLGAAYDFGMGFTQNYAEAVKWYQLAADQGDETAQFSLGWMYHSGKGFVQNHVMAHMWYNIASANGYKDAAYWRDIIAAIMTREEIAKAQAMAQDCISSGYKNCGD